MRFVTAVSLLAAIGGCQCLVPVDETGAGDAGGRDAGPADAGVSEPCARAADCVPRVAPRACLGSTSLPTRSCFNGRCVYDCDGPRTCTTVEGCTTCEANPSICNMDGCNLLDESATGRIYRTCQPGASELLGEFTVRFRAQTACGYDVSFTDGRAFGAFAMADEFDETVARIAAEPGVTCTIRPLATALNRLDVACAACQYVLEWP